jgi:dTDP-4-dehydrorhamnose 3,5-epimerase
MSLIDSVILTPLKRIEHPLGDIMHVMKKSSPGYEGFGEVYFSTVNEGAMKGWKKHLRFTLNLVVPVGVIRFVIAEEENNEFTFKEVILGIKNYQRLTVPPGLWVAFAGIDEFNLLQNVIEEEHDPNESNNCSLDSIDFNW